MRNLLLLMRKDWMSIAVTSRGFLILILVVWLPILVLSPTTIPFMFVLTAYVLVVSLFSMEENDLVCNVVAVLPIRKRDAVFARYLYMYLVLGAEILLCIVTAPLGGMLLNKIAPLSGLGVSGGFAQGLVQCLVPALLSLSGCLLMLSIIMPLAYKFGHTKMRMLIMVIYIFSFMLACGLSPMLSVLPSGSAASLPMLLGAAGGCILLSLVSFAASLRIVR